MKQTLKRKPLIRAIEEPGWTVGVATSAHIRFAEEIVNMIEASAKERGTGRGRRDPAEIIAKMDEGKAIICLSPEGNLVGFCYIETYEEGKYIATSALIVSPEHRKAGAARAIKKMAFNLGKKLYPDATPITITASAAVMKLNTELGFRPVGFHEITQDPKYWEGCKSCVNYDILQRMQGKHCICTAMRHDGVSRSKRLKIVT